MSILLRGHGAHARTGVLLIHGLTGTPNEMRVLARGLNRQGFYGLCGAVGRTLRVHGSAGVDTLAKLAEQRLSWCRSAGALCRSCGGRWPVHGAVLALGLAQRRPEQISGVVALSPTFRYDGWSMPTYTKFSFILPWLRALGIGRRSVFMEQPPYGIKDEALRARIVSQMNSGDSAAAGLPGNPWWAVIELHALSARVRKNLDKVRAPCLVMHAQHDDIAAVGNAYEIVDGVRHAPVELCLLQDSYHMITIDRERRQVIARVVDFCDGY